MNNGKPYPQGEYVCAECYLKIKEVEE